MRVLSWLDWYCNNQNSLPNLVFTVQQWFIDWNLLKPRLSWQVINARSHQSWLLLMINLQSCLPQPVGKWLCSPTQVASIYHFALTCHGSWETTPWIFQLRKAGYRVSQLHTLPSCDPRLDGLLWNMFCTCISEFIKTADHQSHHFAQTMKSFKTWTNKSIYWGQLFIKPSV